MTALLRPSELPQHYARASQRILDGLSERTALSTEQRLRYSYTVLARHVLTQMPGLSGLSVLHRARVRRALLKVARLEGRTFVQTVSGGLKTLLEGFDNNAMEERRGARAEAIHRIELVQEESVGSRRNAAQELHSALQRVFPAGHDLQFKHVKAALLAHREIIESHDLTESHIAAMALDLIFNRQSNTG